MQRINYLVAALTMAAMVSVGCEQDSNILAQENSSSSESTSFFKANPRPQIWADCELFNSVVTPATFHPRSEPFDELYTGGNGFKNGTPLISESKPGDQDYNGGRWHLNVLKEGVDPNKYANACSKEDLDLNDFDSTADYFECPLLPIRGRN